MLEIKRQTKESNITIKYSETVGGKVKIDILGEADLSHHLIEDTFDLLDKLAMCENKLYIPQEIQKQNFIEECEKNIKKMEYYKNLDGAFDDTIYYAQIAQAYCLRASLEDK